MNYFTYSEVVDSLLEGWKWETAEANKNRFISSLPPEATTVALLIDIAKSLRVLRCSNFMALPTTLYRIEGLIEKGIRNPKKRKGRMS